MATVSIKLKKNKINKRGEAPLMLQIVHNRRSTEISLKRYLEPTRWNPAKEQVLGKQDWVGAVNVHLRRKRMECQGIIDDWVAQRKSFTLEDIVRKYKNNGYDLKKSVVEFTDEFIKDNPEDLLPVTMLNYKSFLSRLKLFDEQVQFDQIDRRFLERFEKYLKKEGNKVNTVHSRMKVLRKLVKLAVRQGVIPYDADPFLQYKLRKEPTRRRFLTEEQLHKLEEFEPEDATSRMVLDSFLFACYTGLRFSDLCVLDDDNIQKDENGHRLVLQTSKTRDIVSFRLIDRAVEILRRHGYPGEGLLLPILKEDPTKLSKAALTRHISSMNAYFNRLIKDVAEKAGLNVNPSFHQARHTFATLSLAYGVRMEVVKELLGHSDLKSTQIYAKVLDQAKDEAMELWQNV